MTKDETKNLINELFDKIKVNIKEINVEEENKDSTWFRIYVDEPNLFTHRDGEALHALNHLISRIIENKLLVGTENVERMEPIPRMLVDVNDFQKRKVESVRAVAHMMGERARYFKSNIEIDPMSSFERRVVHEFFANVADLKTESIGFGPKRRVVIKYVGEIQ